MISKLKEKVLHGESVTREEAIQLYPEPLEALCAAADEIRRAFCGDGFDLCAILNAKSGRCSENCKWCAQSAFHHTQAEEYPLLSCEAMVREAQKDAQLGILRFSIVTSGRKLTDAEVNQLCEAIRQIRQKTPLEVCASLGLLTEDQFRRLKDAGISRIHNNLETSRRNFPNVCTTHTFEEKLDAIRAAQRAGLAICSGGIVGLGETPEDRIDLALTLRELGVCSVPVNLLNPIPGTPLAENRILERDELRRIVAVFRFILPQASIRLAGGRGLLGDQGRSCFQSGANAAISGEMLTTSGIRTLTDLQILRDLGFHPQCDAANSSDSH